MTRRGRCLLLAISGAVLAGIGTGCGSQMQMVNTSPTQELAVAEYYEPIDATVYVSDGRVATALRQQGVFTRVFSTSQPVDTPDMELHVVSQSETDDHTGAEFAKAIFSGLLLRVPEFFMSDNYDYSVELTATLFDATGNEIGSYRGVGSYHASVPEIQSGMTMPQQETRAQQLSLEHALEELSTAIKLDREKIVESLRNPAPSSPGKSTQPEPESG